jgi:hypothetical protein
MIWVGYIAWLGEMGDAYNVLVGKPEWKRPLGRPCVHGNIISEWIVGKWSGKLWTG